MKTFYHPDGPKINVQFLMQKDGIASILLDENNEEGCCWQTEYESSKINAWMRAYCEKKPLSTELPLHWTKKFPLFTLSIFKALNKIPFGTFLSYQELAKQVGNPKGARAAGNACGQNPFPLVIPCHRILRSSGTNRLGGFSCGRHIKKNLVNFESNQLIPSIIKSS